MINRDSNIKSSHIKLKVTYNIILFFFFMFFLSLSHATWIGTICIFLSPSPISRHLHCILTPLFPCSLSNNLSIFLWTSSPLQPSTFILNILLYSLLTYVLKISYVHDVPILFQGVKFYCLIIFLWCLFRTWLASPGVRLKLCTAKLNDVRLIRLLLSFLCDR